MTNLPSFRDPPVVEVVLGVQFEPIVGWLAPHLGLAWEKFRRDLPKIEQHDPLPPSFERFGVRRPARSEVSISLTSGAESPRMWMLSEDESELVQLQQDRFIRNWRKRTVPNRAYPRYEDHIRPRFAADLRTFHSFLKEQGLPEPRVTQCEVTYVNHITAGEVWQEHSQLGNVFRGWSEEFGRGWSPSFESIGVQFTKVILDDGGNFIGRLLVQIASAFSSLDSTDESDQKLFALTLTAKGRPTSHNEEGIVGFLDRGRGEIVTTFDRITTEKMHKFWGKDINNGRRS